MSTIRIQSATQTWDADQPRSFVIGRDETCDVVVPEPGVSRRHAEIRAVGDAWEVVDLGSSAGTFVNGRQVTQAPLSGTSSVRVGGPTSGHDLTVTVVAAAPSPAATAMVDRPAPPSYPGQAPVAPGLDMTVLPGNVPGGVPGYPGTPAGPGLLVRLRSGDKQFPAGSQVRIGRDPSLEVVAENPSVSRHHATVEGRPDGWWLVDRSTAGTFIAGERVTAMRIEEPTEVCLGHPTAGYELEIVPVVEAGVASAGIAKKKRNKTLAIAGAAAAVLVVVGGGTTAALVLGGDDDKAPAAQTQQADEGGEGLSEAELDKAKAATVYLVAYGPDGSPLHSGSGSIISDDGLILTNAHVADSDAPGQDGAALDHVEVYFTSPDDDKPVELRYIAEPIVSDGYLDIAIAQITTDPEGNPVDTADLDLPEPLELGDSDEIRTLDEITALGYPGLSTANSDAGGPLPTLTVTKGTVSTISASDIIGVDRAEFDADLRIGSGNSGGPSINEDGKIIGLNTRVFTENIETQLEDAGAGEGGIFTGGSARIVPVNLAEDVLEIAEAGGDPSYTSPYIEKLPDPEQEMASASIAQHGWALDGQQGSCEGDSTIEAPQIVSVAPGDVVHAEFVVSGLASGTLFDIVLFTLDGETELQRLPVTWDEANNDACVFVSFEVPEGVPGINAVPQVGDQYVVDNPLEFQ